MTELGIYQGKVDRLIDNTERTFGLVMTASDKFNSQINEDEIDKLSKKLNKVRNNRVSKIILVEDELRKKPSFMYMVSLKSKRINNSALLNRKIEEVFETERIEFMSMLEKNTSHNFFDKVKFDGDFIIDVPEFQEKGHLFRYSEEELDRMKEIAEHTKFVEKKTFANFLNAYFVVRSDAIKKFIDNCSYEKELSRESVPITNILTYNKREEKVFSILYFVFYFIYVEEYKLLKRLFNEVSYLKLVMNRGFEDELGKKKSLFLQFIGNEESHVNLLFYIDMFVLCEKIRDYLESNGIQRPDYLETISSAYLTKIRSLFDKYLSAILTHDVKDVYSSGTVIPLTCNTLFFLDMVYDLTERNHKTLMKLYDARKEKFECVISDEVRGTLVLEREDYNLIFLAVLHIIENLRKKSKSFSEEIFEHIFMMNNVYFISNEHNEWKFKDLIGKKLDSFIEKKLEDYMSVTWKKLAGTITLDKTGPTGKDLLKRQLQLFQDKMVHLDEIHKKIIIKEKSLSKILHTAANQEVNDLYANFYKKLCEKQLNDPKYCSYPPETVKGLIDRACKVSS